MPRLTRWISTPELRLAFRSLRKQPIVSLTTVLALAVGIGMATTGFTMLEAVLFSKLPFPNGDRFVLLDAYTDPESQRTSLEPDRFQFLREHADAFEHLGAFRGIEVNLQLSSNELVPVSGAVVTPDSIRVTPYAPIVGRSLTSDDGLPGAAPVVLLRESLWRRHFSADPRVIGTQATISGVTRTIVGVMPDAFEFPGSGELWLPLAVSEAAWGSARTFGVLARNIEPRAADAQVSVLSTQFEAQVPAAPRLRILVLRFTDVLSRGLGLLNVILVACLVLILVVISVNIASLVLARTSSRSRELAVRTALGATRGRLVAYVFCEVLLLGVIAATLGLTASLAVLAWVRRTVTEMPFWVDFTAGPLTMIFVAAATLLAAGIAGVLPALKATRRDMMGTMAMSSRGSSAGFGAIGAMMVAAQVALSIALLNGALLMARGVAGYMTPAVLVPAGEVLTARVYAEHSTSAAVVDAIAAIPNVIAAGASSSLPGLSPSTEMTEVQPIVEQSAPAPRPAPVVAVQREFFEALGASVTSGRIFVPADFIANAPPVAVVNAPFVEKFLSGRNPIGRRLRVLPAQPGAPPEPWREIVGVVPDLGLSAGDSSMAAGFYVPMVGQDLFHVAVRASGDARRLASPLRAAIATIDPAIQVKDVIPLQDVGRADRAVFAGIGAAFGALGGMALLLSVVGTYAILSLSVTRRTREIGIRTALGASRAQVLRSIMGKTCLPPAVGALMGVALGQALVAARGIFAFRLPEGSGPWGLAALGAMMIGAALLSAWVPARRAIAVAPAEALRCD